MSKFIVGLAFDSIEHAHGFLSHLGTMSGAAAPVVVHTPQPVPQVAPAPAFQPQQPVPQVGIGAAPPAQQPGGWPAQPAPAGFTPQPAPAPQGFAQPAPAPQQTGYTLQTVLPLMQQYIAMHKAPAAKAAFTKFGFPSSLPQLDHAQLQTMGAFFAAMQPA